MKKLLLLILVFAGMVSTTSAAKRIFFDIQNSSWRNNAAGMMINIWNGGSDNTTWETIPYLTRIGSTDWYYFDVNSSSTEAKIQLVTNSDKTWQSTYAGTVDFTKNNVVYLNSDYSPVITVSTFTGYVIANSSRDKLVDLTQDGLSLTGSLDLSDALADVNFAVFPTFTANEGGVEKYIWDVALRPQSTSDFELSAFQLYNDNVEYGGNGKTWIEKQRMKYSVSFNMSTGKFNITPYRTTTIGSAGYVTWSNDEKYTVEGATAYTVTDMGTYAKLNAQDGEMVYPAGTGLVLGGSGDVTIKAVVSDASTTAYTTSVAANANDLLGSGNNGTTIAAKNYVLYWDGSDPASVGFKITSGGELGAHKAYLPAGSGAREFLGFNEETNGINDINSAKNDGIIYNLQGIRLDKMQKGLNIVNGKKILVK